MSNPKDFSFLLFSDLHSHKDKVLNLTLALSRMTDFLKKEAFDCDYIFIAGDVANQCDYSDTKETMEKLRASVFLKADGKQRVFWAVGNHDIKHGRKHREDIIKDIRDEGKPDKTFESAMLDDDESRPILTQIGMTEYLANYSNVCGQGFDFPDADVLTAHRYFELDELNMFVLNTCLTSCDENDNYKLYIAETRLHTLFDKARPDLPTIVIGHHGIELFDINEQSKIRELFDNRVDMYLCGHLHRASYSSFDISPHEVHQITCGGGKIDGYSRFVFMHGKYDWETNRLTITPYNYAIDGDKSWGVNYRLHSKLGKENNSFLLTRLGRGGDVSGSGSGGCDTSASARSAASAASVVSVVSPVAPESAVSTLLFNKSQAFYDRETGKGGRFFYLKHEDMLLTGVQPFEMKAAPVRGDDDSDTPAPPKNVVQCALESDDHILFIGEGGMGKTTSLLRIWLNELTSTDENRRLPIFVPLNEYNINGEPKFILEYVKNKYHFDLRNATEQFKTILLLDGFNEITRDNRPIISEIKDYMHFENFQTVLTSRTDFRTPHGFDALQAYNLLPLEESIVSKYLAREQHTYEDDMISVLQNPMMLTLYANTSARREEIEKRFPGLFPFKQNRTVAEVLHNYMICEVGKLALPDGHGRLVSAAVALWYIAPYIAHKLESEGRFSMPREQLIVYIREFVDNHGIDVFDEATNRLSGFLNSDTIPQQQNLGALEYARLLTTEHHVFLEEDINYIFRHQYFRDFLSAEYIRAILEKHDYSNEPDPPEVLSGRAYTPNISKMLGECLSEHENTKAFTKKTALHNAIEAMRGKSWEQISYSLFNIVSIWKEVRQNRIIGEDLSKLDFSHVPMYDIQFSENTVATKFDEAVLQTNSLLPMGHTDKIWSAAFSLDGMLVVTASSDGTARVWDVVTGECIRMLKEHNSPVHSAAFSPDGKHIATASIDGTVRIWDSYTSECVKVLKVHGFLAYSAAFSTNSEFIVTTSFATWAQVWELTTGKCVKTLGHHKRIIKNATFSPDGRYVVTASEDGSSRVWDLTTCKSIRILVHKHQVNTAAFSSDGMFIVTASNDPIVRIWDSATGVCIRTLEGHKNAIFSAIFSPDGKQIASASADGTVRVWDSSTGECIRTLKEHDDLVSNAAFSPDGSYIATASGNSSRIWDITTGECIRTLEGYRFINYCAAFSPDNKYFVTTPADKTALVFDSTTGKCVRTLEGHIHSFYYAAFSSDGRLIVTASADKTARIWDFDTGECIRTLKGHDKEVSSAVFSPNGRFIVTASHDNTARLWDSAAGECIRTLEGHDKGVSSAVFSPNGRFIVTASYDNTARLWDSAAGECIRTLEGHTDSIYSADFSPNGRFIVTASSDNTTRIWDFDTGECIRALEGHDKTVVSVIFNPNGMFIATVSDDNTARLWDFDTGECIRTLEVHNDIYNNAAFSSDGQLIVTGAGDGTIKIWNVNTGELINTIYRYSGIHIEGCSFKNAKFSNSTLETIVRQHGGKL